MDSKEFRKALEDSTKYQVRWSYTSRTEPTFGRHCSTLEIAEAEVVEAGIQGMIYIDIVHPDGRVEVKKGQRD